MAAIPTAIAAVVVRRNGRSDSFCFFPGMAFLYRKPLDCPERRQEKYTEPGATIPGFAVILKGEVDMRNFRLLLPLFLISQSAFAFGWTPAIVQMYRDWKNPPPAPTAEQKYCQDLMSIPVSADEWKAENLEKICVQHGGLATAFHNVADPVQNAEDPRSCPQRARKLDLLGTHFKQLSEDCAKSAAASTGTGQESPDSIRDACASALDKLAKEANALAADLGNQADATFKAVTDAESVFHGFASGGVPCRLKRAFLENRSHEIADAERKLAKAAAELFDHAGAAAQALRNQNGASRAGRGGVVEPVGEQQAPPGGETRKAE
jgi:hypothetical protein